MSYSLISRTSCPGDGFQNLPYVVEPDRFDEVVVKPRLP